MEVNGKDGRSAANSKWLSVEMNCMAVVSIQKELYFKCL